MFPASSSGAIPSSLCTHKTEKKSRSKQKTLQYNMWMLQQLRANYCKSNHKLKPIWLQVFSISFFVLFQWSQLVFFLLWKNIRLVRGRQTSVQEKKSSPCSPESWKTWIPVIFVSEGLEAARDTISLLRLLHKFLRLRGFFSFSLTEHTWQWLLAIPVRQKKAFWRVSIPAVSTDTQSAYKSTGPLPIGENTAQSLY